MWSFLLRAFDFAQIDFEKNLGRFTRKTFLLSTKTFLGTSYKALKITRGNNIWIAQMCQNRKRKTTRKLEKNKYTFVKKSNKIHVAIRCYFVDTLVNKVTSDFFTANLIWIIHQYFINVFQMYPKSNGSSSAQHRVPVSLISNTFFNKVVLLFKPFCFIH
jgi:hypothetical protein